MNIIEYLQEFQIRSKRCIEAGTVEEDRRGFYLVKGLPLRHATKVLERFSLRTDSPKTFDYKKIRDYLTKRLEVEEEARMLNPAEAIKEFEPEVEFKVNQITENAKPTREEPTQPVQNTFQPGVLQLPARTVTPKEHQKQSPPGAALTKTEVNDLVDKMLQLKLNRMEVEKMPWMIQWSPRESKLISNPVIQAEVQRQTEERSYSLQRYMPQDQRPARQPMYPKDRGYSQNN